VDVDQNVASDFTLKIGASSETVNVQRGSSFAGDSGCNYNRACTEGMVNILFGNLFCAFRLPAFPFFRFTGQVEAPDKVWREDALQLYLKTKH